MRLTFPAIATGLLLGCGAAEEPSPRINELVAANRTGATDPTGARTDWVELANPTAEPVSLDGWSLGPDASTRQRLDGLTLPAGGHLVLWADGRPEEGLEQLGFKLDVDGEGLVLFDPEDVEVDRVVWGPLIADVALAREGDGADWTVSDSPTPGAANPGEDAGFPEDAVPCEPLAEADRPYLTEGETVQLAGACEGAELAWFGPVRADGSDASWTPGLDDGGPVQALLVADLPNAAAFPRTAVLDLSVADAWNDPENVGVAPRSYTHEWGLPVLHLVDLGPEALTQEYQPTTAWFEGVRYTAQMKIRGAASAGYPKNNFTVEFDPEQLDLKDHGLSNKDHLVLVGNFDDNSHWRQRLVYDTWAAMADFWEVPRLTPRSTPVVVYLGGSYHGLYLALDHVDDEFLREMGLASGANLYKSVNHDANFYLHDAAGLPKADLAAGWEKKEGLPLDDRSDLAALTADAGSLDHATFAGVIDSWVHRDEFMDWFHLVFALACDDSAGKNAYLYADPADGRFRYVPWDFNHAVGQTWQTARQPPEGLNDFVWNNAIFWHLQSDPDLASEHWDRIRAMRQAGGPLALDTLLAQLDAYEAELGAHPERDWEKWGEAYRVYGLWSWRTDWTTPAEERAYVRDWLTTRDAVLEGVLP